MPEIQTISPERAREIWDAAHGEMFWYENIDKHMTAPERAYVMAVWRKMPGHTCWVDAFLRILHGRAPEINA